MPPLLTPELLRELDRARFLPRNRVEGRQAGRHKSPQRGSSTEFRDYREYTQGDDPARVDWRVFARNDRHVIRTYEQEAQTGCVVLLDRSASMNFGEVEPKHRYAARLAACLCHLVVHSQDQAGLCAVNDQREDWFAPAGNQRHLEGILRNLEAGAPAGQTDLAAALHRLFARLSRRATLVVLSDFYCAPGGIFTALNPYLHRHFDVHLLHLLDPRERALPESPLLRFEDLETGEKLKTDPQRLRLRYAERLATHLRGFRELAIRRGVRYETVVTDQPVFSALAGLIA